MTYVDRRALEQIAELRRYNGMPESGWLGVCGMGETPETPSSVSLLVFPESMSTKLRASYGEHAVDVPLGAGDVVSLIGMLAKGLLDSVAICGPDAEPVEPAEV